MAPSSSLQARAAVLDQQDPLARYRDEFFLPEGGIYLDGNSLGLQSKAAHQATIDALSAWKNLGIEGWTKGDNPWFYLPEKLAELMAPLVGAKSEEVIITNSTTVNLHQMLATFYQPKGKRTKIVTDALAFPTDAYAIKSQLTLRGRHPEKDLVLIPSRDGHTLEFDDILASLSDEVAVLLLPGVLYRSGQLLPIKKIVAAAHQLGILVGIDASHSVGAVQHLFHDDNVDFAVWCTYKYLNGGPGSVGALFVHERHLGTKPGLAGWFGSRKDKQFEMSLDLTPATTAGAYQMGTPPVLSMAALLASLTMFHEAGLEALRHKSLQLTEYLRELIQTELVPLGAGMATPADPDERGGHIALTHPQGSALAHALRHRGVIPDFRPPNIIRLAPIAFYTSYQEVYQAIKIIKTILEDEKHLLEQSDRDIVT